MKTRLHSQDSVAATEEGLHKAIFEQHACNVLIVEEEGAPVGFCLYFHTFSTFCGRTNLYLEDLFLNEEVRGRGIGRAVFRILIDIALKPPSSLLIHPQQPFARQIIFFQADPFLSNKKHSLTNGEISALCASRRRMWAVRFTCI